MKKIDWSKGFEGVDGVWRSRDDIVNWYIDQVTDGIRDRLKKQKAAIAALSSKNELQKYYYKILEGIETEIDNIVIAEPCDLDIMAAKWSNEKVAKKSHHNPKNKFYVPVTKRTPKRTIADHLKYIFDYDNFLDVETRGHLGAMLNIKVCPYCNQQYTLNIESFAGSRIKEIAKYQFDHFFAQSKFPFLALSIYNLVPSCAVCNHAKTAEPLPIDLHPYYSDLDSMARFELVNPIPLLEGKKRLFHNRQGRDITEIKLVVQPGNAPRDFTNFVSQLKITERYARHGDIIQEIYVRSYLKRYYNFGRNFSFIPGIDPRLLKRIAHGNYPDRESINKRPLAKLQIDITEQLDKLEMQ